VLLPSAAGSLHVEHFRNLEKLHLKRPNSAYWAINSKAIRSLATLTYLKELVRLHPSVLALTAPTAGLSACTKVTPEALNPIRSRSLCGGHPI